MGRSTKGQRHYSTYTTAYGSSPSHNGSYEDSPLDDSDDSGPDAPAASRRRKRTKSVQFSLASEPSSRSARRSHRSRTPERPPNPFAPAPVPALYPVPIPRVGSYWPPPIQTQQHPPPPPPPPSFSHSHNNRNPFTPVNPPRPPPPPGYAFVTSPYPPTPASGWDGYSTSFYPHSAPPQRTPSSSFLQYAPFAPPQNQPSSASYSQDPRQHLRAPRPQSVAPRDPRDARPKPPSSRQTPSRPSSSPSRQASRLEHDMQQVQRTVGDLLHQQAARDRREAFRARDQATAEREAARSREVESLRREMEQNLRLGLSELRHELQPEIRSEPSHRSDYGMRMYSAPSRSALDEQSHWGDTAGGQPDSHQQEMNQLLEGRRQLEPHNQNHFRDSNRRGGFYGDKAEFDRASLLSSRIDPEHMQRAIQAGVEVVLSELDSYGGLPPSPTAQRPSSTVYGAGEPARRRVQNWRNGTYRSETMAPQSSPFQPPPPPPDFPTSQRRRLARYASSPPQTEADRVRRPRRHHAAREGGGTRTMNITVRRSSSRPARSASRADTNTRAPLPPLARAEPSSRATMSGGRGPIFEEVREIEAGILVRRTPADQVGPRPRRQHPNGYQEPYYEDAEDESDESDRFRLRLRQQQPPPPPAPEPPR